MPNTYSQIHLHIIFAVKHRAALIENEWKDQLYKYITSIIQDNEHKMLQINGMPDQVHILIGHRPHQSISSLVQIVKSESTKFINRAGFIEEQFAWQEGYGAFSYSKSQLPDVINYIQNQEEHHKRKTFLDEYKRILTGFEIDWDERYLFKTPQ